MKKLELLLNDYLDFCKNHKGLDCKTLKAYSIDLYQFLNLNNGKDHFQREFINSYITWLHQTFQPKTCKRKIASLKAFYHYLEFEELLPSNPFHKIELKFREPVRLPKTIPFHIIEAFLNTMYEELEQARTEYTLEKAPKNVCCRSKTRMYFLH